MAFYLLPRLRLFRGVSAPSSRLVILPTFPPTQQRLEASVMDATREWSESSQRRSPTPRQLVRKEALHGRGGVKTRIRSFSVKLAAGSEATRHCSWRSLSLFLSASGIKWPDSKGFPALLTSPFRRTVSGNASVFPMCPPTSHWKGEYKS